MPTVKVTITNAEGKKQSLTEGTDYRVTYENNVNAGTGKVIVKGYGRYTGEISREFTINKKKAKNLKAVANGMEVGSKGKPSIYVYDGASF